MNPQQAPPEYPPGLYAVRAGGGIAMNPPGFARYLALARSASGEYDRETRTWTIAMPVADTHRAAVLTEMAGLGAVITREDFAGTAPPRKDET
jgi:hypothetical protein